jgi:excisionase family DNA binding protein
LKTPCVPIGHCAQVSLYANSLIVHFSCHLRFTTLVAITPDIGRTDYPGGRERRWRQLRGDLRSNRSWPSAVRFEERALLLGALSRGGAQDGVSTSLAKSSARGAIFEGTAAPTVRAIGASARPPERMMAILRNWRNVKRFGICRRNVAGTFILVRSIVSVLARRSSRRDSGLFWRVSLLERAAMKPRHAALDQIMTTAEVAKYLRVHLRTVNKLVHQDRIPAFKVGGDYRLTELQSKSG